MKIVSARATGNFLSIPATTTITAGSINTHAVQFTLSSEWDNLTPTAVFSAGGTEITVAMTDRAAPVVVPWEVTATAVGEYPLDYLALRQTARWCCPHDGHAFVSR